MLVSTLNKLDELKIEKMKQVNLFKHYLENKDVNLNNLFVNACSHGHYKIAKLLLEDPNVDPSEYNNQAIQEACKNGFLKIVNLLLSDPRVDPSDSNNSALELACKHNNLHIIDTLLEDQRVQISFDISCYSEEVQKKFQYVQIIYNAQESNLKKIKISN